MITNTNLTKLLAKARNLIANYDRDMEPLYKEAEVTGDFERYDEVRAYYEAISFDLLVAIVVAVESTLGMVLGYMPGQPVTVQDILDALGGSE